ncbi:MAG TPA: hypothetical protein VHB27_05100 [Rhodopila sp.]|uniref:hypothetical protein n=1 Tax=Rhodopila sp. TaxID=2480087 RepID=UPI002D0FEE1E|nr:hypothetical protein [Rhodopila sp.]HVY14581.1 hypothetical protein [Rhodopila sp.]
MASASPSVPFDRFQVAAAVDRLIYGDETTFDPEDARTVLAQLPRKSSPWIQFGIAGKRSGGSHKGYAAGVGDVKIEDERNRQFEYHSANDAYSRAGQWKLMWIGKRGSQYVEIEQVMSDVTDEGRGAMICYTADGEPVRMEIRVNRSFRLFWSPIVVVVPGWKPWKTPAAPRRAETVNPFA